MARSNTANSGTSYYDLVFQLVSDDGTTQVVRAVIYLTSRNVTDTTNNLSVGGNYSRSGVLGLGGVYNQVPMWSQDIAVTRAIGANYNISVSASWSSVEYWGTTLSAYEEYTVPARYVAPSAPQVGIAWLEPTRAGIYTTVAPADGGGAGIDLINYRVHRVSDGAHMGDMQGGYGGVAFAGLARNTAYNAYGQARNTAGLWGPFSGPVGFTTDAENPTPPPTGADQITPISARIVVTASADNGGAAIDTYEAYVMTNNAWPGAGGNVVASATGGTFTATGLIPSTRYYYTARSRNTRGNWSGFTAMQAFDTLPAASIKDGGVYKNSIPYVKDQGVYKMAIPYTKVGGVYKQ